VPTIAVLASHIGSVSTLPRASKRFVSWTSLNVDDVSTNQSRVCDEVHVVVLLIQAAPLPEHLIGLDPQYYLGDILSGLNKTPGALTPEAVSEYVRCFCCTSTIHATCEDFRAAADIGLEMDEADERAGNKIVAPVHVLWGAKNSVGQLWDVSRPGGRKRPQRLPGAVSIAAIFSKKNVPRNLRGTAALLRHSVIRRTTQERPRRLT